MPLISTNPATDEQIKIYEEWTSNQVNQTISQTHNASQEWRQTSFDDRAALMSKAAAVLRQNCDDCASLMTAEMGKPIGDSRSEIEKCAWVCEYYAENAANFLADEEIETDASKSFVTYQPLGVVLAVMPWNFPFWQVFRFAAPSLMAGNGAVLKHASNVSGCALAIENIFSKAGFPPHLFRTLLIGSDKVRSVLEHSQIRAATLTGSTNAGKAIASHAGELLKKTVLELGGSDPYVVLADADLEQTVNTCVNSRLINSGQSCIAAKRFIVVETIRKEFEERFVEEMRAAKMGDPMDEQTKVGPQARTDLRDDLHGQVRESIAQGARCLVGGEIPELKGAYYPPTVLTDVSPGSPAYSDELFGPVAAIIPVKDEREAIRVANDSSFGLGAAVFTRNTARGEEIASKELEAGCCFVNEFVKSDPRLPFGGIKESGYGRELSHFGIKEFVNIKTVFVR